MSTTRKFSFTLNTEKQPKNLLRFQETGENPAIVTLYTQKDASGEVTLKLAEKQPKNKIHFVEDGTTLLGRNGFYLDAEVHALLGAPDSLKARVTVKDDAATLALTA